MSYGLIVGCGNAGLEAIVDSIPYASKITLLVRGTELRGDAITQEKVKTHSKVTILYNSVTKEVVGEKYVTGGSNCLGNFISFSIHKLPWSSKYDLPESGFLFIRILCIIMKQ
jgi:thioredoxin reductase